MSCLPAHASGPVRRPQPRVQKGEVAASLGAGLAISSELLLDFLIQRFEQGAFEAAIEHLRMNALHAAPDAGGVPRRDATISMARVTLRFVAAFASTRANSRKAMAASTPCRPRCGNPWR